METLIAEIFTHLGVRISGNAMARLKSGDTHKRAPFRLRSGPGELRRTGTARVTGVPALVPSAQVADDSRALHTPVGGGTKRWADFPSLTRRVVIS